MKKSKKKEAILNTAEKLFYQHGFHSIGVKAILDEAGVAPMTMYYHFKSKEEVIKEILVRRENHYFELVEEKLNKRESIDTYIMSLMHAHMDWIEAEGTNGCLFLRAKQEYEGINEEIASLSREHKKTLLNRIENDLKPFDVPGSFGVQISIILEGLTSMAQIQEVDEVKEAAVDLVKGLQVQASEY
ncbi:TetR/AcrR family transcriptional regulator [Sediminibacillus halophilus]|uniref:DNA-binding transcriptional regulator, AcrR family n=1 Tax=Sediminibacillus halophilus TaxID=482461 RepID=A0A1G9R424_9BACI|nr:TetR/AcrR family transcriptional regulator [Sediminibacillus halophilus]SDM17973.1 DNA-binding transcriptional regulator, AcrR family [Sediminibacillus halophilus]